jgi:hypothetical protein
MPTRKFGFGSFSIGFVCGFCLYYAVPLPPKWAIRSAHQIEDSSSAAVPIVSPPATPPCIDFKRTQPEPFAEQDILNGAIGNLRQQSLEFEESNSLQHRSSLPLPH